VGPYKTCISAHRHISAYRGAWWLTTLSHGSRRRREYGWI